MRFAPPTPGSLSVLCKLLRTVLFSFLSLFCADGWTSGHVDRKKKTRVARITHKQKPSPPHHLSQRFKRFHDAPQLGFVPGKRFGGGRHKEGKHFAALECHRRQVDRVRAHDFIIVKVGAVGHGAFVGFFVGGGGESILQIIVGAGKTLERFFDVAQLERPVVFAGPAKRDDVGALA